MEEKLNVKNYSKQITRLFPIFLFLFLIIVFIMCPKFSSDIKEPKAKVVEDRGIIENINFNGNAQDSIVENVKDNLLYGNITLDSAEFISVDITIYNRFDYELIFEGVITDVNDQKIYSNSNIEYQIQGLKVGEIISPKTRKDFTLFFKLKTLDGKNNLKFYLNLAFKNDTMIIYDDMVTFIPYNSELVPVSLQEMPNCNFLGYFDENNNQYYSSDGLPLKLNTDLRILVLHSECE